LQVALAALVADRAVERMIDEPRAFLTVSESVITVGGVPSRPGRKSLTPMAQEATGFGMPATSTRHMRQLPAIESRS
jgi:hypothetical protein